MNINYISIYKIFFFIFLITIGCKYENKYKIIPPEQFVDIYLELNINSNIESVHDTSFSKQKINSDLTTILKKNNLTENDLKHTIEIYNKDIVKWQEFYENLRIKLEKLYSTYN